MCPPRIQNVRLRRARWPPPALAVARRRAGATAPTAAADQGTSSSASRAAVGDGRRVQPGRSQRHDRHPRFDARRRPPAPGRGCSCASASSTAMRRPGSGSTSRPRCRLRLRQRRIVRYRVGDERRDAASVLPPTPGDPAFPLRGAVTFQWRRGVPVRDRTRRGRRAAGRPEPPGADRLHHPQCSRPARRPRTGYEQPRIVGDDGVDAQSTARRSGAASSTVQAYSSPPPARTARTSAGVMSRQWAMIASKRPPCKGPLGAGGAAARGRRRAPRAPGQRQPPRRVVAPRARDRPAQAQRGIDGPHATRLNRCIGRADQRTLHQSAPPAPPRVPHTGDLQVDVELQADEVRTREMLPTLLAASASRARATPRSRGRAAAARSRPALAQVRRTRSCRRPRAARRQSSRACCPARSRSAPL